jgi:hypothetical protein
MNAIDSEALASLTAAIESFLPDVADPSVQLALLVAPEHITPTGLGGFIGINEDPQGEILGRRLEAMAVVTVRANSVDPLNDAVAAVVCAFLGADRTALLEQGILRVALDGAGSQPAGSSESDAVVERGLTLKILYEFLKRPEEPEDVILEIPKNLNTA